VLRACYPATDTQPQRIIEYPYADLREEEAYALSCSEIRSLEMFILRDLEENFAELASWFNNDGMDKTSDNNLAIVWTAVRNTLWHDWANSKFDIASYFGVLENSIDVSVKED
jgi:hypothetical protein